MQAGLQGGGFLVELALQRGDHADADELATSPAACPPMPSATTSRRGPAYPESSLSWRTSPTSERAA